MEANQWYVTYGDGYKLTATYDRMRAVRQARSLVLTGTINVRLNGRATTPWREEPFTMEEVTSWIGQVGPDAVLEGWYSGPESEVAKRVIFDEAVNQGRILVHWESFLMWR